MKIKSETLLHTIGLGAVLTCGALLVGCAGNSPKATAVAEPEKQPEQTVMVEQSQPVAGQPGVEQSQPEDKPIDTMTDVAAITAIDSDIIEVQKPEQLVFQFGFDKAELGGEDTEIIKQHAGYLKANPDMMVKVIGHTDQYGPKAYNEYLSKKRAEAVSTILIAEGVTKSQIEIKAMANDSPLENAKHARDNRRVELQFESLNLVSK